jgi:hypothetical protein
MQPSPKTPSNTLSPLRGHRSWHFNTTVHPSRLTEPFTAPDGTKYANLRNPAIREALGVTEVADPPYFDQRFYWGVDNPKLLDDREEVDENGDPMWVKVLDNSELRTLSWWTLMSVW